MADVPFAPDPGWGAFNESTRRRHRPRRHVGWFDMEIAGAKDINTALRKVGGDPQLLSELRAANRKAAEVIVPAVKRHVPVGEKPKTVRRLHETVRAASSRTAAKVKAGGKKQFYAWIRHTDKGYHPGGGTTKVEGVPYMREGISEAYGKFIVFYEDALSKVTEKFNRRYGISPQEAKRLQPKQVSAATVMEVKLALAKAVKDRV